MEILFQGHRPVPVLIPPESKKPLEFLASFEARREANVPSGNKYLFPNTGNFKHPVITIYIIRIHRVL